MKRKILVLLLIAGPLWGAEAPFKRGVNLTGWFQASNTRQIQFTKFTKQDFVNIRSLGCDVIRLPINLHSMTSGEPDYIIEPLFFSFLDEAVSWAEELKLHLILDNHSFNPSVDTDPNIVNILVPVWTQMAEHYKEHSNFIYYEILNEPHGISDEVWNSIQQTVINAIRSVDKKHTIIVGPASWNSYNNLKNMPEYEDDNLIYTFHFYDPFLFTHQGASWTNPSMVPLAGVPFPYSGVIPECPPELKGTWIEGNLSNYNREGTIEHVQELIDIAVDFKNQRDVPIFCGEFGVHKPNSSNINRIIWYLVVRVYFEEKNIPWTIWDYTNSFGLFEKGTNELFESDLNIPLVQALGLVAPPQQEYVLMPDVNGFDLYLDYIAPKIVDSSWLDAGLLDYYSTDNPAAGNYCIHWTGVEQYKPISLRFVPIKDLSFLMENDFVLDFWIRCNDSDAKIDIRFVDTDTDDPDDHPWRMRYTIDKNTAAWNGQWNHLQIPLKEFSEYGSWDGQWFNPVGAFDWTAVNLFEIVPEHSDLFGTDIYFDNIRITKPLP